MEKVITDIKNGTDGIHPELLRLFGNNLRSAVSGVLDSGSFGDKYFGLQQELSSNVTKFASYKAWHASEQIRAALKDTSGNERSAEEYKRYAEYIFGKFNGYQVAEYTTAVARTRTARQWENFATNKTPNIRWIASRSATQREEHKKFYGIVLPKDSPFWRQNQPGNLWNCKCDWEETDDKADKSAPEGNVCSVGLEGNPGVTREIFGQRVTYFANAKDKRDDVDKALLSLKSGGFFEQKAGTTPVDVHVLHNAGELSGNIETLTAFLKDRNDVERVQLLPIITDANIKLRSDFYPEGKYPRGKLQNADAIIEFANKEKWVVDFKAMQGNGGKLSDRLKESYEQADYAIIKIKNDKPKVDEVIKQANSFMKQHKYFKGLFIYDKAGTLIYERTN
jgi:hypothetical protein